MKLRHKLILCVTAAAALFGCAESDDDSGSSQSPKSKTAISASALQSILDNAGSEVDLSGYTLDLSGDTSASVTINKSLTVNGDSIDLQNIKITVAADSVALNDIKNTSVTVDKSVGNGSLKIAGSSLSTLSISGGGINSIYIEGTDVGDITLAKDRASYQDEFVRLVTNDSTNIKGSITVSKDALLYYNGTNADFAFDAAKIKLGQNAVLGSNASFSKLDENKKTVTVTDEQSKKKFITIVDAGKTLNQDFFCDAVEKAFGTVPTQIISDSGAPIDFTAAVTDNLTYTVPAREYEFRIAFDKDADKPPYSLVDDKTKKSVSLNLTGDLSDRSYHSITDDLGNVYFTQKTGSVINLITLTYPEAAKLINGDSGNWKTTPILNAAFPSITGTFTDNFSVRLAMFKKGATRHLYFAAKSLWSANNKQTINGQTQTILGAITIYAYNITDNHYNDVSAVVLNSLDLNGFPLAAEDIPGLNLKDTATTYFYSQGIAVDGDENLYLDICRFDVSADNTKGTITFDESKSAIVRKYKPTFTAATAATGAALTLTKAGDKSYSDLGVPTSYTFDNHLPAGTAAPSLWDYLSAYTFGITDLSCANDAITITYYDKSEKQQTKNVSCETWKQ